MHHITDPACWNYIEDCRRKISRKNRSRVDECIAIAETFRVLRQLGYLYKAGLNKSISDVARGKFFQILKYKAKKQGKTVIAVPPQYTSQICSG